MVRSVFVVSVYTKVAECTAHYRKEKKKLKRTLDHARDKCE